MINAPQRVLQVVVSKGGTLVEHLQEVVTMHVRDAVDEVWRIAAVFMQRLRPRVCILSSEQATNNSALQHGRQG